MPIPSYILPSAPAYTEDSVYALIPTPSTPIYTPDAISFTRGSDATRTASNGLIQKSPVNLIQQSESFDNGVWTKVGSSVTLNTTIAPNGTLTADSLIENTATSAHEMVQTFSTISGNVYTYSIYVKANGRNLIKITLANQFGINSLSYYDLVNGTTYGVGATATASIQSVGNGWYRCVITSTATSTGTAIPYLTLIISSTTSNYTGDGISGLFIWGAQLVEGSQPLTYFPTTDRLNVPRIDFSQGSCPALLLEPQRTNSIRNSSAVGAVVGVPGTRPTNWEITATGGLSLDIVQLGIVGVLNYVDYRIYGTATGTSCRLSFELSTQIAATVGQAWSYSLYAQAITGTLPTPQLRFVERNSAGGALVTGEQAISVSSTFDRFAYTRTTVNALCAFIVPELIFSITSGASYDFTIRVAAPQMELGSYTTTYIPTTTTSVTRLADSFSKSNIYTNGLITATGGTWYVELRKNLSLTRDAFSNGLRISDSNSTVNNGFEIRNGATIPLIITKRIAGASTTLIGTTASTTKLAIKWNGSTCDVFLDGVKQVSGSAFTATNMEFLIGSAEDVPKFIQGMALFSTPLSDATLITMTT